MQLLITTEQKIQFKTKLKQFCRESIEARINVAKQAMAEAQEAANSEEKSSAGDKYETSRAMSHLQKDMQASQLSAYVKELAALHAVDVSKLYDQIETGSLVKAGNLFYFLGSGLGKHMVDDTSIIFLSPTAPLARGMLQRKKGEEFTFNGRSEMIEDLF